MSAFSVASRVRVAFAAVVLAAVLAPAAVAAPPATSIYFEIGAYPAGALDLPGATPNPTTGYFYGSWNTRDVARPPQRLEQVRGGVVVPSFPGPVTVQAGDVFRIVRTSDAAILAQTTFDGKPTLSDKSCVGQNGFDGARGTDTAIVVRRSGPLQLTQQSSYGPYYDRDSWGGHIRALGDGMFSGVFDDPIATGDLLEATQTSDKRSGDTQTTVVTTTWRVAGACPPPVPPVPDTTPPKSLSFDLGAPKTSVASFLKFGLTNFLGIDEPGTITQALYLDDGSKLPASAAKKSKKKTKKAKKAVLLGSGRTTSTVAGVIKVSIKPTKQAKSLLKHKKSAKVVLLTTIKDVPGNVTNLAPKKLKLQGG